MAYTSDSEERESTADDITLVFIINLLSAKHDYGRF